MFTANHNYSIIGESYLFSEVARRIAYYRKSNPDADIIRMDIGDVSLPLPQVVTDAMHKAVNDMGASETFHGYGPEQGYLWLRSAIAANDYTARGISHIGADDIFISDGAKSDLGNLCDLFGDGVTVAVPDPGYPVYVDTNVLDGRAGRFVNGKWSGLTYLRCSAENGFKPSLPDEEADVIYLCYPNNPTGAVLTHDELKRWVDYAIEHRSLIIYDSAYEAYVSTPGVVRSVYEVEGAERVAIEVRSFSKSAGFTGVRCGYTVVPRSLDFNFAGRNGGQADLNRMWNRRQSTKFNGVGYVVQRAAEALYTPEGQKAIADNTGYYMENARALRAALLSKGYDVVGGVDSPYVWFRPTPASESETVDSWQEFDRLLHEHQLSCTPGVGFGPEGEGWLRFTGFNSRENTLRAINRLK